MVVEDLNKMFLWGARIMEIMLALVLLVSGRFFYKAASAVPDIFVEYWIAMLWLCIAMGAVALRMGVARKEIGRKWQMMMLGMLMLAFVSGSNILRSLVGFSH